MSFLNIPNWLQPHEDENVVMLAILVSPKASRTRIVGEHEQRLKIQLTAPPEDNQANDLLIKFLATLLNIAQAQVEIVGGHSSKRKTVRILQVPVHKIMLKLMPVKHR